MANEGTLSLLIICVLLLNLFTLIYIGKAQALEGRTKNRTDITNKTFVSLISSFTVAFNGFA